MKYRQTRRLLNIASDLTLRLNWKLEQKKDEFEVLQSRASQKSFEVECSKNVEVNFCVIFFLKKQI